MNNTDLGRLADRCERLAELIRTRGSRALTVAQQWRAAPPPHVTAERGGTDQLETRDKRDRLDPLRHQRLLANIGRLDVDVATLTGLILDTVPREPDQRTESDCPDGACENCWTDNRYYEPVAHYRRWCRWCGDFKGAEGQLPPRALLKKRHANQRITTVDVERALGRSA